jgi:hypothetical protein
MSFEQTVVERMFLGMKQKNKEIREVFKKDDIVIEFYIDLYNGNSFRVEYNTPKSFTNFLFAIDNSISDETKKIKINTEKLKMALFCC